MVQRDSDTERCLFMFDAKGAWLLIRPGWSATAELMPWYSCENIAMQNALVSGLPEQHCCSWPPEADHKLGGIWIQQELFSLFLNVNAGKSSNCHAQHATTTQLLILSANHYHMYHMISCEHLRAQTSRKLTQTTTQGEHMRWDYNKYLQHAILDNDLHYKKSW